MTACLGGSGGADLGRRSGFWWPSVVVLAYFLRRTARFSEVSGWLEGREAANQSRGGGAITFLGEGSYRYHIPLQCRFGVGREVFVDNSASDCQTGR